MRFLAMAVLLFIPITSAFAHTKVTNINVADAETLDRELVGVGAKLAVRIVRNRDQHGPFELPSDRANLPDVRTKVFERNRTE